MENGKYRIETPGYADYFSGENENPDDTPVPVPVDYLNGAVASCMAISYEAAAKKLGIGLRGLRTEVKSDLDMKKVYGIVPGGPALNGFHVRFIVDAPDADEYLLRRAAVKAERSSVVGKTLGVSITYSWERDSAGDKER
jgi:uncharacterized OsmC-like protein